MLCLDAITKHFYTSNCNHLEHFDDLSSQAIQSLISQRFPNLPVPASPSPILPLQPTPPLMEEDSVVENLAIPVSKWDGLLVAEMILRPNNDHRILDLSSNEDRARMSQAIKTMSFLDAHDAHSISDSLDMCMDGLLPEAPKMSITEMEAVCLQKTPDSRS